MKRFFSWTLGITACLGLVFIVLFSSLYLCLNDDEWFKTELYRLDTARKTGYYNSQLYEALDSAREKIFDPASDSDIFNDSETNTLLEISAAFRGLRIVFIVSLLLLVLSLATILPAMRYEALTIFCVSYIAACGVWLLPISAFLTAMGVSFRSLMSFLSSLMGIDTSHHSEGILSALFSDTLLFDLLERGLTIGLIITGALLVASIVYTVVKTRRRHLPLTLTRREHAQQ